MFKINLKTIGVWLAAVPLACILAVVNSPAAHATTPPDECFNWLLMGDYYRIVDYDASVSEECRPAILTLPTEHEGLPVRQITEMFMRYPMQKDLGFYDYEGWTRPEAIDFNNVSFVGDWTRYFENIGLKSVENVGFRVVGSRMFAYNELTTVRLSAEHTNTLFHDAFIGNKLETVYIDGVMPGSAQYPNAMTESYARAFVGADYSTEHFVRLYTDDPNYKNAIDFINSEPLAGRLVNPAQIYLKFVDEDGNELKPTEEIVSPDSNIKNYNITADLGSTVDEVAAKYYFAGQNYTYAPSEISGYETPAAQSVTLNPERNELTFVYKKKVDSSDAAPNSNGAQTGGSEASNSEGDLAQTGVDADKMLLAGASALAVGVMLFVRKLRG